MSKKPDLSILEGSVNPFSVPLKIKVYQASSDIELTSNDTTSTSTFKTKYPLERDKYTKVYFNTDIRNVVLNLNFEALKIWTYITYDIDTNKDYIWINFSFLGNLLGIRNKLKFELYIKDLIINGLITYTVVKDVYWINPAVIFCGNRIKKYPNNIERVF